jgi:hypothetical protein
MATMRLLNIDAKKWSMDRGLGLTNPWEVAPHLPSEDRGHLPLQWLPLQRGQDPGWGWGCLPGCPPLSILCRSAPPVHHGRKFKIQAQSDGALSESSSEAMVSLIFFSPVSKT